MPLYGSAVVWHLVESDRCAVGVVQIVESQVGEEPQVIGLLWHRWHHNRGSEGDWHGVAMVGCYDWARIPQAFKEATMSPIV